ncbi:MAG: pyruvate carboxylase subunit B [Sciscionella sp.]
MGDPVSVIETSLRDGQQSLWATRMTTAMLLPALQPLDRAGFTAIECMATVVMDACVRYLKENPWERLRLIRQRVTRTPLGMMAGSIFSAGAGGILPDDLSELFIRTCARNGIGRFFFQDGLNDPRNLEVPIRAAKAEGAVVQAASTFSISPVHTDEHFVARIGFLKRLGADVIVLKDANGLLTPERVRTLVPALREAAGEVPVFCHTHCVTGLGPASMLEAVRCGTQGVWLASAPLANGTSLPSTDTMVGHLQRMGRAPALDRAAIAEVSEHFRDVAQRHRLPIGAPAEYDPTWYEHQMPGGMVSNFRAQLAQLGLAERFEEVLAEIPSVRSDLGWAIMVTPFSQIIATQAALNVLYGRYAVIPDEVKKVVMGYYGRTPASVSQNLLDRVADDASPITERPGDRIPHVLDRIRTDDGPFDSDEDLLLHALFRPDSLREMYQSGPIPTEDVSSHGSVVDIVRRVAEHGGVSRFSMVRHGAA